MTAASVRERPSGESVLVSQILFGEKVMVTSRKGHWILVRSLMDETEGWVDEKQFSYLESLQSSSTHICVDLVSPVFSDGRSTLVTIGAELPDYDGILSSAYGVSYRFSGQAVDFDNGQYRTDIIEKIARKFLNTPELSGGRTPVGIDTAAFIQLVYKCVGISVPRTLPEMAKTGEIVHFTDETIPGDVAFFSAEHSGIGHAGLVLANQQIMHVYGMTRIDLLDHYGIFNADINEYTHRLKIIKRIVSDDPETGQ